MPPTMPETMKTTLVEPQPHSETDGKIKIIGRKKQLNESVYKLLTNHFVALIGESGSGKSVLLKRGITSAISGKLAPDLFKMNQEENTVWRIAEMRPGHAPFEHLAASLVSSQIISTSADIPIDKKHQDAQEDIKIALKRDYFGLVDYYKKNHHQENLLLIIDQFEDIFRYRNLMDEERKADIIDFINNIVEAVNDKSIGIYIAIAIDSNYLGQAAGIQGFSKTIYQGQYFVPSLKIQEIRKVYRAEIIKTFETAFDKFQQHPSSQIIKNGNSYTLNRQTLKEELLETEQVLTKLTDCVEKNILNASSLLFVSMYALNSTLKNWIAQFNFFPEETIDLEDFKSVAELYQNGAKSAFDSSIHLNNFVERDFEEWYNNWAFSLDSGHLQSNLLVENLLNEWKMVEYDTEVGWDVNNTTANQIVHKSASVVSKLFSEQLPSQPQATSDFLSRNIKDPLKRMVEKSESLWNVNDPDKKDQIERNFKRNISLIDSRIHDISQFPDEEKVHLIPTINNDLKDIETQSQVVFQSIFKALTTKERSGLDVRLPIKIKDLWQLGILSLEDRNSPELNDFLANRNDTYKGIVSNILRQLTAVGIIEIIPLIPAVYTQKEHALNFDYSPDDIVDLSSDNYIAALQGRLQNWIREESKNSSIYLQLVRSTKQYENPTDGDKRKYLLDDYKLGLNLNWRKTQYPSDGWAARYDSELDLLDNQTTQTRPSASTRSKYLPKALDFLMKSQDNYIENEKKKKYKLEKRRRGRNRVTVAMTCLGIVATFMAITAYKQESLANNRLFEVNAINLLEEFDQAGFIPKDSIKNYKEDLNNRLSGKKRIKAKRQASFLSIFLEEKSILQPLEESSISEQAITSMLDFHLKEEEDRDQSFLDLLTVIHPNKTTQNTIIADINEYHNYIYHALDARYKHIVGTDVNNRIDHGSSIFSLISNPQDRSVFAFGDNEGKVYLRQKENNRIRLLHTLEDHNEANIVTALHFHQSLLFTGNDGGKILIYEFDKYRPQVKPQLKDSIDISNRSNLKSPNIDEIFAFTVEGSKANTFIITRVDEHIFLTDIVQKQTSKIGTSNSNIIGCGILDDQLVVVDQKGISFFPIDKVLERRVFIKKDIPHNKLIFDVPMNQSTISPTSKLIALADEGGNLYLTQLDSLNNLTLKLFRNQPHSMKIEDLSFHPDGDQLASASLDGTAKIYFDLTKCFSLEEPHLNVHADIKVKDNGSPMYYITYNNDKELITTIDISIKVWSPDCFSLREQLCEVMKDASMKSNCE